MEESETERLMDVSDVDDQDEGDDDQKSTPLTTPLNGDDLKRKRAEDGDEEFTPVFDVEGTPSKRVKAETPPPPPPPPPPCDEMSIDTDRNDADILGQAAPGVLSIDESSPRAGQHEMDEDPSPGSPQQDLLSSSTDRALSEYTQVNSDTLQHVEIPNGA